MEHHNAKQSKVVLRLMSGDEVILDPEVQLDHRVEDVRDRLLNLSGVSVAIFCDATALQNGSVLSDFVQDGSDTLTLNVMKYPCKVSPDEYSNYIDAETVGLLPVSNIRYERFHRFEEPTEEESGTDFFDLWTYYKQHGKPIPHENYPTSSFRRVKQDWSVQFPESQNININMLPFQLGNKDSVPEAYHHYWPIIEACQDHIAESDLGQVAYLTIQESLVPAGQSQRRGGIHVESPGTLTASGEFINDRYNWGCGFVNWDESRIEGGIFMASNVPNSCRAWNVKLTDPTQIVGALGSAEHLREQLGEGCILEANKLYWLTDLTPHESLPLEEETYRQLFRLVTGSLSAWYSAHSTANPLVKLPAETEVVLGSKFA